LIINSGYICDYIDNIIYDNCFIFYRPYDRVYDIEICIVYIYYFFYLPLEKYIKLYILLLDVPVVDNIYVNELAFPFKKTLKRNQLLNVFDPKII